MPGGPPPFSRLQSPHFESGSHSAVFHGSYMGWWPCEPRKHLVGASQLWRAGVLLGRGCWDMGGAWVWTIPGTLPICTCSGSANGPWGLGTIWGRGSGHPRELSSLIRSLGTLFFACSQGRGSGVDQTIWQVVSGFPNGIWAGKGGWSPSSPAHPPGPVSQDQGSYCGGTKHSSQVREVGSQAQGDQMGRKYI